MPNYIVVEAKKYLPEEEASGVYAWNTEIALLNDSMWKIREMRDKTQTDDGYVVWDNLYKAIRDALEEVGEY